MPTLDRAIRIAAEAHEGARDKGGRPYVLHPIRVMLRMDADAERMAGVLHDLVEDTDWTLEDLRCEGFPAEVVEAVDALTRRKGEDYMDFIRRAGADPIARKVKLADLEDNLDPSRLPNPTEQDLARLERYRRALDLLHSLP